MITGFLSTLSYSITLMLPFNDKIKHMNKAWGIQRTETMGMIYVRGLFLAPASRLPKETSSWNQNLLLSFALAPYIILCRVTKRLGSKESVVFIHIDSILESLQVLCRLNEPQ